MNEFNNDENIRAGYKKWKCFKFIYIENRVRRKCDGTESREGLLFGGIVINSDIADGASASENDAADKKDGCRGFQVGIDELELNGGRFHIAYKKPWYMKERWRSLLVSAIFQIIMECPKSLKT